MKRIQIWFSALAVIACLVGMSCATGTSSTQSSDDRQTRQSTSKSKARPGKSAVQNRVEAARKRLQSSKAGELVWKSIAAHGGLETWYENGPLSFRYTYRPLGERQVRDTFQTVDTWSARARHQMATDRSKEYGWDGQHAWYKPEEWTPPHHVAFWALTPYYFVAMPFVLSDPGVQLEYRGDAKIKGDVCDLIRVTFESDTGQSPDDYYYIYLDRKTHELRALRYVVAYDEFYPEGGHSPEKLMTYDGSQQIDGITFAESYRFFMWDADRKTDGDKVTVARLRDVRFRPDVPDRFFEMPENAAVFDSD